MQELVAVVIGECEIYVCSLEFVDSWLVSGYRLFGVADSQYDTEVLYAQAKKEAGT